MRDENAEASADFPTSPLWRRLAWLVAGLVMLGLTVHQYFDLSNAEQTGETIWMTRHFAKLYELFGKWGVVIPLGLVSLFILAIGVEEITGIEIFHKPMTWLKDRFKKLSGVSCPSCHEPLPTRKAKQCMKCGANWR